MKNSFDLQRIDSCLDMALSDFWDNKQISKPATLNDKKLRIIALFRISKKQFPFLFCNYLIRLMQLLNCSLYFYQDFSSFFQLRHKMMPTQKIKWFLDTHNYSALERQKMRLTDDEKKIYNQLPGEQNFLSLVEAFIYSPTTVQRFFSENPLFFLSDEELSILSSLQKSKTPLKNIQEFISLYSELPTHLQESVFSELVGMHLGYQTAQSEKITKNALR